MNDDTVGEMIDFMPDFSQMMGGMMTSKHTIKVTMPQHPDAEGDPVVIQLDAGQEGPNGDVEITVVGRPANMEEYNAVIAVLQNLV